MKEDFLKQIDRLTDSDKSCKILVGISGGADSVVLSHLLFKSGISIGLAHCNFMLRGSESDKDESFVRNFANEMQVPIYVEHFETKDFALKNKISVQMAARELRFAWFQELANQFGYKYIALAHHADDQIETFFINLFRGSGIRGLSGMLAKNGNYIRPLLTMQRIEIEQYAHENNLSFRTDSSNAKNDYLRNNIRNRLLPQLYQLVEGSKTGILQSLKYLSGNENLYDELVSGMTKDLIQTQNEFVTIDKEKLLAIHFSNAFLFECISPFGFKRHQIDAIAIALRSEPGRIFYSQSHRLTINRDVIEIAPFGQTDFKSQYVVNEQDNEISFPVSLQFSIEDFHQDFEILKLSEIALFDFNLLQYPLHLRKWKESDRFVPFGMRGSQLISDFFINHHLTKHEKENCWLLCDRNDAIVWIVGYRISDNFKITTKTKQVLKIHKIPSE